MFTALPWRCRKFEAGHGNPYELSLVPKSKIRGQDHWSISASGVCRVGADSTVDFVPSGMGVVQHVCPASDLVLSVLQ